MSRTLRWGAGALLSLVLLAMPFAAYAATSQVTIADFSFTPSSITVNAGDTVKWMNNGPSMHTVTSNTGAFNSGTLQSGQSFSFTFASAGTFAYHCTIHPFMTGTVTVTGASVVS